MLESTHAPPPPVSDEPAPEPSDRRKVVLILDMIRKFFRKTRETMRAYREGLTPGPEMAKSLKTYKSHRRISEAQ